MARRKTIDTWQLHVNYGQGWEHEVTEFSWKDMREQLKTYRANCSYPVKSVFARERRNCECQNCGLLWHENELKVIQRYHERVAEDEPVPNGECPDCGALCHEVAA